MQAFFSKEDLNRLAQIIREETGNQIQEKNFSMIEARIRSRMTRLRFETIEEYWEYFSVNESSERIVLQGLMTTHYTFFFREHIHFESLEKWINLEWPRLKDRYIKTNEPVKVWSAACSRGQEVYSLALFLEINLYKKHGIPFQVLGTDIDSESIETAANGVYTIKEVNTIPQIYLNGFWRKGTGPIKDYAAINKYIKSKTRFAVHNLIGNSSKISNEKFDVIFCRNVFIYFSEANVKQIIHNLLKQLNVNGMFISGISEPVKIEGWPFNLIGPSSYHILPEQIKNETVASANEHRALVSKLKSSYKVLCVDDSPTIQTLLKKIYTGCNDFTQVDIASNGKEARIKLDQNKYDLVTLDIHMPEINGIQFLENHYDFKNDPPVLMVSSVNRADMELAGKALSLGAVDYIEKPELNTLHKSTDEIIAKSKLIIQSKKTLSFVEKKTFDESISQKIVVPDATQFLRVIVTNRSKLPQLKQIINSIDCELRSPPCIILWTQKNDKILDSEIKNLTTRNLNIKHGGFSYLKPDNIYFVSNQEDLENVDFNQFQSISLQVLDGNFSDLQKFKSLKSVQVLLEESYQNNIHDFEKNSGLHVNDVAMPNSFASLSIECFANVRKLSA